MERTLSCGYRPGFVKSICYQTLPFVFDEMSRKCAAGGSVVVVVSPLISLMEDQVASLRKRGSMQPLLPLEAVSRMSFVLLTTDLGKYSHLFCAPEALISSRWREALLRVRSIIDNSMLHYLW